MYDWETDWTNAFFFRMYKHANLWPYRGRDPYHQFEDAMWILAIEMNYDITLWG